ncbi:mitochondrial import inner membrane translocase subunit TIM50-like [Limulus polyphemus]|uniref:Mitochondrial import inner membrane translocase subunit TIM50 n=1 Tax=Limulus polyphemus TaxID=6850 RepID=A0ABM1BU10_LIMPO|nr:mitochondrial import inner membrane translocase subunit TIM50-like [Limulus polyphemus]
MAVTVGMCFCRTLISLNKRVVQRHLSSGLKGHSRCSWILSNIPNSHVAFQRKISRFCNMLYSSDKLNNSKFESSGGDITTPADSGNASPRSSLGLADQIMKTKFKEEKSSSSESQLSDSKDKQDKRKSDGFSKRAMKYTFIAFGSLMSGIAGLLVYEWGAPLKDENGNVIKDEFSEMSAWKAYILRTYKEIRYYDKMIKDPSREKLLPDPLTEPYFQPPYTLVLEMTDVLVHPDWTYQTGWRFKKRPGVDFFLQQVAPPLFEVVIYTAEQGFTAFPIIDTLDPNGFIMYRLFRDATRYMEGHHVKDLSCLNRDLSKVIFIDCNEKSFQLQPKNALKLKKWDGRDDDRVLVDLAVFLRTVATSGVEDVRSVLDYYRQFDDPLGVFKENQRRLQEEQERQMKELQEEKQKTLVQSWTSGLFRRR